MSNQTNLVKYSHFFRVHELENGIDWSILVFHKNVYFSIWIK